MYVKRQGGGGGVIMGFFEFGGGGGDFEEVSKVNFHFKNHGKHKRND